MRCAICGQLVQPGDAHVPTTDGGVVHAVCADREARTAWARRRRWALLHALVVVILCAPLPWTGAQYWLLMLLGTGAITHPLLHRRAWYYLVRDLGAWLHKQRLE